MKTCRLFVIAATLTALLVVCAPRSLLAHPGHVPVASTNGRRFQSQPTTDRNWTIQHSALPVRGSFVMARSDVVQIRRADDSLVNLRIESLSLSDQQYVRQRMAQIRAAVARPSFAAHPLRETPFKLATPSIFVAQAAGRTATAQVVSPPALARHFDPFVKLKAIRTRWDEQYVYVESNGIPAHPMMVGITSWQQQVPIPQKYVGDNAWRIPLKPVPAKSPAMTNDRFLRGAIALAVNGIPIFNPLNNRGDDAYLFGELDEYGGHCGRADDYHYHLAPVHLGETVGKDQPIAYALDGYPIFGYQDPKAADYAPLDKLNGHKDAQGRYHYHATKTYPYLNGGFYGEVVEKDGQVDPQPRAEPLRPSLPPMRGAKITKFEQTSPGTNRLTYEIERRIGTVTYALRPDGTAVFEFVDPAGKTTTETYSPRQRGPGGDRKGPARSGDRQPPQDSPPTKKKKKGDSRSRSEELPTETSRPGTTTASPSSAVGAAKNSLLVTSTSVDSKGRLSIDCTCDGKGQSPAVAWKNAPAGTKALAVSLWHTAPDQEKSYWLVYNIPADTMQLAQNAKSVGKVGLNDKRRAEFDPMCSKGPGVKTYHLTVYALSKTIDLPPEKATRAGLREAIQGITLAEGTFDFQYERSGDTE